MNTTQPFQSGLFDAPPPAQKQSRTSLEAASSIRVDASTLRGHVLAFLKGRGSHGATDEEIQNAIGMNPSTQRPRRIELVNAGMVTDSGKTRKTLSGRSAVVWVAV